MHNKSAIIVMMAAVMLGIISGCGKKDNAWIDPPIVKVPAEISALNIESTSPKSKLIEARDALRVPSASRKQYGISGAGQNESEAVIAARFMKPFDEWRDYRSQLPDKFTLVKSDSKNGSAAAGENIKPKIPDIVYIPEYSKSTDILNWKIRIMLLEARLKTIGEADRKLVEDKLKIARDSLVESERVYGKLIPTAPAVPIVPELDDNSNRPTIGKEITVANMDSNNITDTLAGLNKTNIRQVTNNSITNNQSILIDYRIKLNETITDIDKVLVELGKRR